MLLANADHSYGWWQDLTQAAGQATAGRMRHHEAATRAAHLSSLQLRQAEKFQQGSRGKQHNTLKCMTEPFHLITAATTLEGQLK